MGDFATDSYRQFIFYRTYSRWDEEKGRRETWPEVVDRYLSFMREKIGDMLTSGEYETIREAVINQEVVPSMRLMWAAGNSARKSNVAGYNCSFVAPTKFQDFGEILYLLASTCGVGFSVEKQFVDQFPEVDKQTSVKTDFVIDDSREGWADALVYGITKWFGGEDVEFDYGELRPAGARLKTMGGRSSGPDPLKNLLVFTRAKILDRQSKKLRPIDVHDIVCKIGEVIVSGGVRRSAEISLSDLTDDEMRDAKKGAFYNNEPQRSLANNSAVYNEKPGLSTFMNEWMALVESGSGERGIFNRGGLVAQMPERRIESMTGYIDATGTNPCLTGDTLIATVDGAKSFKELADEGKDVLVHAWNKETKKPVVRFMRNPRKTREDVRVIEVEFDSGLKVRCTPDHNFYTFRGEKIMAKDLMVGKSVRAWSMSEHRDGHLRVHGWDSIENKANHQYVARMVYEEAFGTIPEDMIIHHKDGDKLNNSVDNLEALTRAEHNSEHYQERFDNGFNGKSFNHKIVSVKEAGTADVYNGTVDDVHTYIVLDKDPVSGIMSGIVSANCGEITLRNKQFCNLTEVIARAGDSAVDLIEKVRIATILGTYQSMLTDFGYLSEDWKINCEAERLLGVSITGQFDCKQVRNAETLKMLKDYAVKINKKYAKRFGITQSMSVTCVKPSGTVSQLVDASSGMHTRHSPYYIRRVRISTTDPLLMMMKAQGMKPVPEVGQAEETATTWVLEFPIKAPKGSITGDDMTAIEQLEHWKMVKNNFTEHNPSVTISVASDEWLEVANWVWNNWDIIGGLAFLPKSDHVYQLAPYEAIAKEQYDEMVANMPELDFSKLSDFEYEDKTEGAKAAACVSADGVCEI